MQTQELILGQSNLCRPRNGIDRRWKATRVGLPIADDDLAKTPTISIWRDVAVLDLSDDQAYAAANDFLRRHGG